jgi:lantibiotic modifying enzyme
LQPFFLNFSPPGRARAFFQNGLMPETTPPPAAPSWRPLLDGRPADEAREVIRAIAGRLRGWSPAPEEMSHAGPAACVAGGEAGLALFFAYLALAGFEDTAAETAAAFLGRAMDRVADEPMNPSLYSGFTGVAWATAHLQRHLFGPAEGATGAVDDALEDFLAQSPWRGEFDLINGLVGFGVYALQRLPDPAGARLLGRVVDCLDECSTAAPEGKTWWTDPRWLGAPTRDKFPKGYFNLGLAHGTPGVIALLGRACASGVNAAKARAFLGETITWTLAQEYRDGDWTGFPAWIEPGALPGKSRLAWCYGDPGIAVALLGAARAAGEAAWEEKALAVARRAARCPLELSVVRDACLCHGAAGAGHLFNRLYQNTGDPVFADAARFWLAHTLALRVPKRGVAGYSALWNLEGDRAEWRAEAGFLLGAAGIGLALLAAVTPVEPLWDRILLADLPVAPDPGERAGSRVAATR